MAAISRREAGKLTLFGMAWLGMSGSSAWKKPSSTPLELAKNGFYATKDTQCYEWCIDNPTHPDQPMIMQEIATNPVARWLLEGDNTQIINSYLTAAAEKNQLGVMVAYNIPNRDMGSHSAGGAQNAAAYAEWAIQCAKAIGNRPCMIILEPDSIMHMVGRPENEQKTQCDILNSAIDAFAAHAPNAWIYADAGNGEWPPAERVAPLLNRLHTKKLRGFSLNVSNYNTDEECAALAADLMKRLEATGTPLKGWVLDTSRNGNGPAPDDAWCNPPGRKLGKLPSVGYMGADANLWIKLPGESDGECGAYPDLKAGAFSPIIARNLIKGL